MEPVICGKIGLGEAGLAEEAEISLALLTNRDNRRATVWNCLSVGRLGAGVLSAIGEETILGIWECRWLLATADLSSLMS